MVVVWYGATTATTTTIASSWVGAEGGDGRGFACGTRLVEVETTGGGVMPKMVLFGGVHGVGDTSTHGGFRAGCKRR